MRKGKHFFQPYKNKSHKSDYQLPPPGPNGKEEAEARGIILEALNKTNNAPDYPDMKLCSAGRGCGKTKSRHDFSSDPGSKDGRSDICRKCSARLGRESRARKKAG